MITREEAKEKLAENRLTILNYKMEKINDDVSIGLVTRSDEGKQYNLAIDIIDELFDQQDKLKQHIKSLEAQLANIKQLTCCGCRWDAKVKHIQTHPHCLDCIRGEHGDFYEPKDTQ